MHCSIMLSIIPFALLHVSASLSSYSISRQCNCSIMNRAASPIYSVLYSILLVMLIITTLESARRARNYDQSLANYIFANGSTYLKVAYRHHSKARFLSAQNLMNRPLATDLTTVPKILHQSWSTSSLPSKFERWSQSCREVCHLLPPGHMKLLFVLWDAYLHDRSLHHSSHGLRV